MSKKEKVEPIYIYQVNPGLIRLGCNEFDDVEFLVSNVDTEDEAKAKVAAFIAHLIKNGYEF
jgi:hypothetical protein